MTVDINGIPNFPKKYLYLDKLFSNPNNLIMVSIKGINSNPAYKFDSGSYFSLTNTSKPLIFFINGDITFSGNNQFEAPLENALNGLRKFAQGYNVVQNEFNLPSGFNLGNISVKNQLQTVLQWVTSDRKSFNLPVLFLKWRKDQSLLDYIEILERATAPAKIGSKDDFDLITKAPGNYDIDEKGNAKDGGTCSVQIGKWFSADQLVLTNYNLSVSAQDITRYGDPVLTSGTITVSAQKLLDGDTIAKWLIKPSVI